MLPPEAKALIEAVGLRRPTTAEPGYWKTDDGFVVVNIGLLMDGFAADPIQLRALVSFDPRDAQKIAKQRMHNEYPDYDNMDTNSRRSVWRRFLQIAKQARTERVAQVVTELNDRGIELQVHDIVVHRVSNTFFVTLDLDTLSRLVTSRADGYVELRRIHIEKAVSR